MRRREVPLDNFGILTLAALLATASHAALAQPIGAGGQLQQIPPAPVAEPTIPEIRIERSQARADLPDTGERIAVNSLQVTGETLFSEAELIAAAGFQPGSRLSLSDLRTLAGRMSAYYNSRGYFVAQAYLPAQDIRDGAVTIAVVEGHYGAVTLNNGSRLSDGVAHGILSGLGAGDVVASAPLERRLLLLSDIPGIGVNSTLAPGAAVGTSDLIVDITEGRRISGVVQADNAGNRYTGEYRAGAVVNFNNITGRGDVASLRVLSSFEGMNYARASYQTQLRAATVGVAYSWLGYELGEEFAALEADGTATILSAFASYPLIRSYRTNLYGVLLGEAKSFEDNIGATGLTSKKSARTLTAGLNGEHRDTLGGGGWSFFSLNATVGELDIETDVVRAVDDATARTNGGYQKLAFEAGRLQQVAGPLSLYGAVKGQVASKNLDPSEKMELGGAYNVRAYPEGEGFGDEGYVATLEARVTLPRWPMPGRLQAFGFVDHGSITINKDPWAAGESRRTLSGAGVGLIWAEVNNFMVKISYAMKLGDEEATSAPDRDGRLWVQLSKFF